MQNLTNRHQSKGCNKGFTDKEKHGKHKHADNRKNKNQPCQVFIGFGNINKSDFRIILYLPNILLVSLIDYYD